MIPSSIGILLEKHAKITYCTTTDESARRHLPRNSCTTQKRQVEESRCRFRHRSKMHGPDFCCGVERLSDVHRFRRNGRARHAIQRSRYNSEIHCHESVSLELQTSRRQRNVSSAYRVAPQSS